MYIYKIECETKFGKHVEIVEAEYLTDAEDSLFEKIPFLKTIRLISMEEKQEGEKFEFKGFEVEDKRNELLNKLDMIIELLGTEKTLHELVEVLSLEDLEKALKCVDQNNLIEVFRREG